MSVAHPRHHNFVVALFQDGRRAGEFFRNFLPRRIAGRLDSFAHPDLADGSFVHEGLSGSQSDLLFRMKLKSGGSGLMHALIEHKSQPEFRTPFQVARYIALVMERSASELPSHRRSVPPVIAIVLYHGKAPWNIPRSLDEMVEGEAELKEDGLRLRYHLVDVGRLGEVGLKDLDPELAAGLGALAAMSLPLPEFKAAMPRLLGALPDDSNLLRYMVSYLSSRDGIERTDVDRAGHAAKPGLWDAIMDDYFAEAREEGIEQGIERGRTQGRAEGVASSLSLLLGSRFGALPEEVVARIDQAELPALESWLGKAVRASSIGEVFEERA